jgi:hypothetical protein
MNQLNALSNRVEYYGPRYQWFVTFTVLINLLWLIPGLVQTFVPATPEPTVQGMTALLLVIVLFVVIIIVVVRRAILFPAIAVDAAGATWSNARNDTKGSSWRVAFIFLCAALPMMIVVMPLYYMLFAPTGGVVGPARYAFMAITSVIQVAAIGAFAATASHVFKALADRLARPVG